MKIFCEQCAFGQRVMCVGIESGGDSDEFGAIAAQIVQRLIEFGAIRFPTCIWPDGIIKTISANAYFASAGITGMLVDGKKFHAVLVQQNILGAVAVMHIKIKYRDAFCAGRSCFECGDGNVVQVAEAH